MGRPASVGGPTGMTQRPTLEDQSVNKMALDVDASSRQAVAMTAGSKSRPGTGAKLATKRGPGRTSSTLWALLFVGPNLVLFTIFIVIPIIAAFTLSLFQWDLISDPRFIGLQNYFDIAKDSRALNSIIKTAYLVFAGVVPTVLLSFGLAVLINTRFVLYSFFRTLYLLPIVISFVASAVLWRFI